MVITKDGQPWGVATIDVTLGFFNQLAKQMNDAISGRVLIVEADGKIVGDAAQVGKTASLKKLADLGDDPMAQTVQKALSTFRPARKPSRSMIRTAIRIP